MKFWNNLAGLCAGIVMLALATTPLRAESLLEAVNGSPALIGESFAIGQRVFKANCAGCHEGSTSRAPQPAVLRNMRPETILRALNEGVMKPMAGSLSEGERMAVSEYLAMRKFASADAKVSPKACDARHAGFDRRAVPTQTGWGFDAANSHAVSAKAAGLTAFRSRQAQAEMGLRFR